MSQGALGDDYATVRVPRSWVPWASVAYKGVGSWDFKNNKPGDPEVHWLDSVHLLIRYNYRSGTGGEVQPVVVEAKLVPSKSSATLYACLERQ